MTRRRRIVGTAAVWLLGFGVLRLSLLAPERCPSATPAEVLASASAAGGWLAAGQRPDGRYLYEYDRSTGRPIPGYNLVRHAGVTMSLYQLAAADRGDGRARALAAADAGLEHMLHRLEPAGTGRALVERGSAAARSGASALMVAALLDRRQVTDDDRHDDVLRALGRFLAGAVGPDGHVPADIDVDSGERGAPSRYSTGEVGWALARLHTVFPSEGWDAPARRVAQYLATERDEVEDLTPAPWPDQWAAYLLAELAPDGLSPEESAYARRLAERMGPIIRFESQKGGWPVPFGDVRARGAGLGVWVEGLGSLAGVAVLDPRLADLRPAIDERLSCGAGLLVERQVVDGDPNEAGAWFRDDVTRMDDEQHALSGLLAAGGMLERSR
jgi:hypothetical protein